MRKLLVLFLLMITFALSRAQVSDSLMNVALTATVDSTKADAYTQISKKWAPSNFDSSLFYATKAIEFAKKANSPFHLGHAYNAGGLSFGYAYRPAEAWPFYEKAIIEFLSVGNQEMAGAMYTNSGVDYYLTGQLDSAMMRYTSAIPMYEAVNSEKQLARTFNNMALIYNKLGLKEEAIAYYEKSLEVKERRNDVEGILTTELNLASLYYETNDFPRSLTFARSVYSSSLKLGEKDGESASLLQIGQCLAELEQLDSALFYCEGAYHVALESGLKARQLNAAATLAQFHSAVSNQEEATFYANEAIKFESDVVGPMAKALCYEVLAESAEKSNLLDSALAMRKLEILFRDSAMNVQKNDRVEELVTEYEKVAQEEAISEVERELEASKNKLKRGVLYTVLGVLAIVGLSVVIVMITSRNKKRESETKGQLKEQLNQIDALQQLLASQNNPDQSTDSTDGFELNTVEVNAQLKNPLTEREMEVLSAVALGKTNTQVAEELFVSVNTVKTHLARIYDKLAVSNRTEATDKASKLNLLD